MKLRESESLQDLPRQTNEQLLLSAFNANDSADSANSALALLDAVLRQMPGGVVVVDPATGLISHSNDAARGLWPGCACIADMARYFEAKCFSAAGISCAADDLPLSLSLRTGKRIPRQEVRFARADGSQGTMSVEADAVRDRSGCVIAVVLTCQDISVQKAADERERAVLLQLRDLSAKLESAREEERTRLAGELHDELGQVLTGINFDLEWLLKQIPREKGAARERIESMIDELRRTIQKVQRISSDLRPPILDGFGLIPTIEWQMAEFQRRTGIRAQIRRQGDCDREIDGDTSTAAFRILQEALTNVIRHAHASKVVLGLKIDDRSLVLTVSDNGHGIRRSEIDNPASLGIVGIRERVTRLGGKFSIGQRSPNGTRFEISFPLASTGPRETSVAAGRRGGRREPEVIKTRGKGAGS